MKYATRWTLSGHEVRINHATFEDAAESVRHVLTTYPAVDRVLISSPGSWPLLGIDLVASRSSELRRSPEVKFAKPDSGRVGAIRRFFGRAVPGAPR